MFISSTFVILYVLVRPILSSINRCLTCDISHYPHSLLYAVAFCVVFECLKCAYGWGKNIQYNSIPQGTFAGEVIGSSVLFAFTMSAYVLYVSNFVLRPTQILLLSTFLKRFAQLILFSYFLYRLYKIAQWLRQFGAKLRTAPNTVDKSNLKIVSAAALLFHCQMILHESYSWATIAILCTCFVASLLCFDLLSNLNYILECAERSFMIVSSNSLLRSTLLSYCDMCDRVGSFVLKEKSRDHGYPACSFF